jgi:hypothetical protein
VNPDWTRQTRRRRAAVAAVLALVVHAALLSSMGLVRPRLAARLRAEDGGPAPELQLQLLPESAPKGSEPVTAQARQARRAALAASPVASLVSPAPTATEIVPPAAGPAEGAGTGPDAATARPAGLPCAPEDLILLSPAEREKCHDQIDIARTRAAQAMEAAERAERLAAMRRAPRVDSIPADKRAGFDAAAAAQAAVREDFRQAALADVLANRRTLGPKGQNLDVNLSVHCAVPLGGGRAVVRCPYNPSSPPAGQARAAPP